MSEQFYRFRTWDRKTVILSGVEAAAFLKTKTWCSVMAIGKKQPINNPPGQQAKPVNRLFVRPPEERKFLSNRFAQEAGSKNGVAKRGARR